MKKMLSIILSFVVMFMMIPANEERAVNADSVCEVCSGIQNEKFYHSPILYGGSVQVECPTCHGKKSINKTETCSLCRGTGKKTYVLPNGESKTITCPNCNGKATTTKAYVCPQCNGSGKIWKTETPTTTKAAPTTTKKTSSTTKAKTVTTTKTTTTRKTTTTVTTSVTTTTTNYYDNEANLKKEWTFKSDVQDSKEVCVCKLYNDGTLYISGCYVYSVDFGTNKDEIKRIIISDGGIGRLDNFKNLETIEYQDSVNSIGSFCNCHKLSLINFSTSVFNIQEYAFRNCDTLKSVIIPDSVTNIGAYAFAECDSLESVVIPASVTTIGNKAFQLCSNLTIYGNSGSKAEHYAKENNIPFALISENPAVTTVTTQQTTSSTSSTAINTTTTTTEIPYSITTSYENRLEIVKLPDRTEFSIGEMYDLSGGLIRYKVIKYCYDNGGYIVVEDSGNIEMNSEAIDLETDYDPNTKGKYTINLRYKDPYSGYDEYSSPKASFCVNVVSSAVITTQTTTSTFTTSLSTTTENKDNHIIGDANGDGNVTVADAVAILQYIGNKDKYNLSEQGKKNSDVDGVAGITGTDALTIQKVDAGIIKLEDLPLKTNA